MYNNFKRTLATPIIYLKIVSEEALAKVLKVDTVKATVDGQPVIKIKSDKHFQSLIVKSVMPLVLTWLLICCLIQAFGIYYIPFMFLGIYLAFVFDYVWFSQVDELIVLNLLKTCVTQINLPLKKKPH